MGLFSGILKTFSTKDIKETVKQFSTLREMYIRDQNAVMQQLEDMRNQQSFEQSKADEALAAARERSQELVLRKKLAEERKSEKYISQMNKIKKVLEEGQKNPAFLTRFSGLRQRKSLIGKK